MGGPEMRRQDHAPCPAPSLQALATVADRLEHHGDLGQQGLLPGAVPEIGVDGGDQFLGPVPHRIGQRVEMRAPGRHIGHPWLDPQGAGRGVQRIAQVTIARWSAR